MKVVCCDYPNWKEHGAMRNMRFGHTHSSFDVNGDDVKYYADYQGSRLRHCRKKKKNKKKKNKKKTNKKQNKKTTTTTTKNNALLRHTFTFHSKLVGIFHSKQHTILKKYIGLWKFCCVNVTVALQFANSKLFCFFFVFLIWGRLKLHFRQYSRNIFTLSPVGSWFIVHVCTCSSLDGMRHLNDVTLNVILYVNDVNITLSVVNKMLSVFSLVIRWLHEEIKSVSWHNHQIHSQTFKWPKY